MVAGRQGMRLEGLKFGIYIGIPVVASALFNEPETIQWFVDYFQFVTYPAPASSSDEIRKQLEAQTKQQMLLREQKKEYSKQLNQLDQLVNKNKQLEMDDDKSSNLEGGNKRWYNPTTWFSR